MYAVYVTYSTGAHILDGTYNNAVRANNRAIQIRTTRRDVKVTIIAV